MPAIHILRIEWFDRDIPANAPEDFDGIIDIIVRYWIDRGDDECPHDVHVLSVTRDGVKVDLTRAEEGRIVAACFEDMGVFA